MRRRLSLILLVALAACAGDPPLLAPPPAPPVALSASESPPPPELRLPTTVAPVRYQATIALVPSEPGFQGTIAIDLALTKAQSLIWLNGSGLTVSEARIEVAGRSLP